MCWFSSTFFKEWGTTTGRRIYSLMLQANSKLFHYHQLSLCIPSECQLDICLPWPVLQPDHVTPDHIICFASMLKIMQLLSCSAILHELYGSILWSRKPFVLVSLLSSLRYRFWESTHVNLDASTLTNDLWIIQQQLQIQSLHPWPPVHG